MSVKQAPQETVASYDMRFRQVASQLNQALSGSHLPEETLVPWFHEGLRPEYQDELERDQPETLQEAVKSAEKAERIKKRQHRHGMPGMVGVVSSSRGTQQLQEADVTTQMMQQLAYKNVWKTGADDADVDCQPARTAATSVWPCFQ